MVDRHCFVPQMIVKYNAACSRWRTSRSELPYLEPHLTTGFGEDGRITDGGNDSDDGRVAARVTVLTVLLTVTVNCTQMYIVKLQVVVVVEWGVI